MFWTKFMQSSLRFFTDLSQIHNYSPLTCKEPHGGQNFPKSTIDHSPRSKPRVQVEPPAAGGHPSDIGGPSSSRSGPTQPPWFGSTYVAYQHDFIIYAKTAWSDDSLTLTDEQWVLTLVASPPPYPSYACCCPLVPCSYRILQAESDLYAR